MTARLRVNPTRLQCRDCPESAYWIARDLPVGWIVVDEGTRAYALCGGCHLAIGRAVLGKGRVG